MDDHSLRRFIGCIARRHTFPAIAMVLFGCSGGSVDDARPLLGRWQMVEGTSAVFDFLEDGLLVGVIDGDQEFGSYEIVRPGALLLELDGDSVLADFRVAGDTLHLSMVGGPVWVGVRDGG